MNYRNLVAVEYPKYMIAQNILDNEGSPEWCNSGCVKKECKTLKKFLIRGYKKRQKLQLDEKLKKMDKHGKKEMIEKMMKKTWKQIDKFLNKTKARKRRRKRWTRKFRYL
jgi:hypothetical protein